jgi:hypothetical protein
LFSISIVAFVRLFLAGFLVRGVEAAKVKMECFRNDCKEVFVEGHGVTVTVNTWANCEGVSFMVHGKDGAIRTASSMRWEELDVLLCGLVAARGA